MKSLKYIFIVFTLIFISSCNDDILDKSPLDEISPEQYWKTSNDLKLFLNQFYTSFTVHSGWNGGTFVIDNNSDNLARRNPNSRLVGDNNVVPTSGGGWNWESIRAVNYYLENSASAEGGQDLIDHYNGEGHFFRAMFYFNLLKRFGDLPYIDKTLNIDSPELLSERLSRNVIADKIVADLDIAITNLKSKSSVENFRVHRGIALALKSRVCLYEGTWEKYHNGTDFAAANNESDKFLNLAIEASEMLINEGNYSLYTNGGDPTSSYWSLFNKFDYSGVSEVMFWKQYDKQDGVFHRVAHYIPQGGAGTGLTKSLVESYLCTDGEPISTSSLYTVGHEASLTSIIVDRDPRLAQTICTPGDLLIERSAGANVVFDFPLFNGSGEGLNTTGYQIYKGGTPDETERSGSSQGSIIFRYAEVLLNFAEAKAELGSLTQGDLDKSINKLRDRVGMAHLSLVPASDPNKAFPGLSNIINEVRRERRVELALEGRRFDDLMRWRAHDLFVGKRFRGFKIIGSTNMEAEFAGNIGSNILVDADGYVDLYKNVMPSGFGFNPNRDYLSPIPTEEIILSDNKIKQNPGWE
jgi:hypothetical protein